MKRKNRKTTRYENQCADLYCYLCDIKIGDNPYYNLDGWVYNYSVCERCYLMIETLLDDMFWEYKHKIDSMYSKERYNEPS